MEIVSDWAFRIKRQILGPRRTRRVRLYGVGTAKSGTHSICSMFSKNVRAGHEKQALQSIGIFFQWHEGRLSDAELMDWIQGRDTDLALEVDASWFNVLFIPFLVRKFPEARFVWTIRDCYSWLNSEFKRVLHIPSRQPLRIKMRKFLHDPHNAAHAPEEAVLKENGLYTIDGYLSHWATHNERILTTVPGKQLLIVRTEQIRERAYEIADFAGLPRYAVQLNRTHEYRNPVQRDIIREIDRNFLEKKVEQHCRPLMSRFFPEIKSLDDAKI